MKAIIWAALVVAVAACGGAAAGADETAAPAATAASAASLAVASVQAVPVQTQVGPFTGLIVDCRGIKIHRTMGPCIYDQDGHSVWGLVKMDYSEALDRGKVGYYKSVEQAVATRVGSNPLIVRAVGANGNVNYPCDAVIGLADGALVAAANDKSRFLDNYKVGFLVD